MTINRYKILLVEDVVIAQKLGSMVLHQIGCDVDMAENGTQAIEQVKKNQYQFILMDLGLPDISGIEVTKTIRKMEYGKDTFIVALTAHDNEEDKKNCEIAGMNGFFTKPLNLEQAKIILEKYLSYQNS